MASFEKQKVNTVYRQIRPHPDLHEFVKCYWTMTTSNFELQHRLIPNGGVNILFEWTRASVGCRVIGTMTRPVLKRYEVPTRVFGVSFCPGGASGFFDQPLNLFTNKSCPIGKLWSDCQKVNALLESPNAGEEAVKRMDELLLQKYRHAKSHRVLGQIALDRIVGQYGGIDVGGLAKDFGTSRQQITRAVKAVCGVCPKRLARILRLNHLLRCVKSTDEHSWASLALEFGFYDQAHMIREFREFAGITPAAFVAELFNE